MRRREFVGFLAGAFFSPLAARAQQPAGPVIAFLSSRSPEEAAGHTAAFLQGLKAFGYVDGRNGRRSKRSVLRLAARSTHRARRPSQDRGDLSYPRVPGGRRADEL